MLPTLTENVEARNDPSSLTEPLSPKTSFDAFVLGRSLSETCLWIGALCIMQDDETQMASDISNMDTVYNKAFATIVAMHGTSANAGLLGVRPKMRPAQNIETLVIKAGSEFVD
ncbi:hypothetical protein BKA63DRAFT_508414 [Paraphoma chrysanthemicola]|nr:hypothetical protein BKA63DRAFT_508414 [Paraphoma chrysanthemicola]